MEYASTMTFKRLRQQTLQCQQILLIQWHSQGGGRWGAKGENAHPFFSEKIKTKNELNYLENCTVTPYHTNRCFSFLNAAKNCRKADYKDVWLSISTKFSLHNFKFGGQLQKGLGVAVPIWPQLCYYYCNNMELNSWLRSPHERCPKH